jgi:hypothetical protein
MDNFLRLAQDTLFCFKPFKGIFLINGEPIVALSEIPLECNVVLVGKSNFQNVLIQKIIFLFTT